jgi:hypothetical protein
MFSMTKANKDILKKTAPVKKDDQIDWEMDDNMLEHFKDIGLVEDDEEDYIARL